MQITTLVPPAGEPVALAAARQFLRIQYDGEDDLVALAYENPPTGELICFTITYRRGQGNKPEGTLDDGDTVKLKEGMIFNVTATDKS